VSLQEVSQSLWSLAKLRAKRPRLLRALAGQVSTLIEELSARDLATVVWAFGTLQHHPVSAVQLDLARAARSRFDDFEPQVPCLQAVPCKGTCMRGLPRHDS
jgi:hypothetical protein